MINAIKTSQNTTMKAKKVLQLNLKKEWFDMILYGTGASRPKREEYRELKQYWEDRLYEKGKKGELIPLIFDEIVFKNGYQKNAPTFVTNHLYTFEWYGVTEWGATYNQKCFVIGFDKIFRTSNI